MKGIFPEYTASIVKNKKFKLCHVDVFQGAKETTEWTWDKLVVRDIIIYDDLGFSGTQSVTKFVESQREKTDRIVMHNLNDHGIIIIKTI